MGNLATAKSRTTRALLFSLVFTYFHHFFIGNGGDPYTSSYLFRNGTTKFFVPLKIYGKVYIEETGGENMNGIFANKFERVCGHKGYSYNYFQLNERARAGSVSKNDDEVSLGFNSAGAQSKAGYIIMDEIGYENCDYISQDGGWKFWTQHFKDEKLRGTPLELHIPCRDPIDHLMSSCNFLSKSIPCDAPTDELLYKSIEQCTLFQDQFHFNLTKQFEVKCYDFKLQFSNYTRYMSNNLQHKRFESLPYFSRDSNKVRNKKNECIWKSPGIEEKVREYLITKYDYYMFCDLCIGGENDILHMQQYELGQ